MRYLILALADDIDLAPGDTTTVEFDAGRQRMVLRSGDRETYGVSWLLTTPGEIVEQQCGALLATRERRIAA